MGTRNTFCQNGSIARIPSVVHGKFSNGSRNPVGPYIVSFAIQFVVGILFAIMVILKRDAG